MGDIELQKIHKKENPADMLTKIVQGVKFAHCKVQLLELGRACLDEPRMA